jgi:hypothetical protein
MGLSVDRKSKTKGYFTVLLFSFAAGLLLFLLQTAVFRLTFSTAGELPIWMTD